MKTTIYNPTNERIGLFAHNRRVVVEPKNSVIVSEKMGKSMLAKDTRLTRGQVSYTPDQIKLVDGMKKNALVVLAKSLMRGVPISPEEAAVQADGIPPEGSADNDQAADDDAT